MNELRTVQQLNSQCQKNTISLVISPNPEDSLKMNIKDFKKITNKHLENLGLKENQWIATIHPSTGKTHIHIIANRIDKNGKALNDSFIGKRAQKSAENIAIELGLKTAKDVQLEKTALHRELNKAIISEIKNAHFDILKMKPKDLKEYERSLMKLGIVPEFVKNKKGKVQGLKFLHVGAGKVFKASQISKLIRYDKLVKDIALSIPKKIISKSIGLER